MREDENMLESDEVLSPFLMECKGCNNVVIRNISMVSFLFLRKKIIPPPPPKKKVDSPFWTLHPYNCSFWTIDGLKIYAPINGPNIDGIGERSFFPATKFSLFFRSRFFKQLSDRELRGGKFLTTLDSPFVLFRLRVGMITSA